MSSPASDRSEIASWRCRYCGARDDTYRTYCPRCGEDGALRPDQPPPGSLVGVAPTPAESATPEKAWSEVDATPRERVRSGIVGLDHVLGGGIALGSGVLIGGEPGAGKTTLLTQLCQLWTHGPVVYASTEEDAEQIAERGKRLGVKGREGLWILPKPDMETAQDVARRRKPTLFILDSIQATVSRALPGRAGSPSQMKHVATELCTSLKRSGCTLFVVSQINKDGSLNGPKAVEHIGDAVVYLAGPRTSKVKRLLAFKNRFGPTDRDAALEMGEQGLRDAGIDTAQRDGAEPVEDMIGREPSMRSRRARPR